MDNESLVKKYFAFFNETLMEMYKNTRVVLLNGKDDGKKYDNDTIYYLSIEIKKEGREHIIYKSDYHNDDHDDDDDDDHNDDDHRELRAFRDVKFTLYDHLKKEIKSKDIRVLYNDDKYENISLVVKLDIIPFIKEAMSQQNIKKPQLNFGVHENCKCFIIT